MKGVFWANLSEAILKSIGLLGPIFIAQVGLICLITYRLVKNPNEADKKKISYMELVLSFIASFIFIFMYVVFGILGGIKLLLYKNNSSKSIFFALQAIFISLIFLILTPFGLTTLRVALADRLTEQQKTIISGVTIPLTIAIGWYGTLFAIGYH
jgi:hypothetical protein